MSKIRFANTCFSNSSVTITTTNTNADVLDACSSSGKSGTLFTARENTISVEGYLTAGESKDFDRFINNEEIPVSYTIGKKDGAGNWVPGTVVNYFFPSCRISEYSHPESDGIVRKNLTIQPFSKDTLPEIYINTL